MVVFHAGAVLCTLLCECVRVRRSAVKYFHHVTPKELKRGGKKKNSVCLFDFIVSNDTASVAELVSLHITHTSTTLPIRCFVAINN